MFLLTTNISAKYLVTYKSLLTTDRRNDGVQPFFRYSVATFAKARQAKFATRLYVSGSTNGNIT